MSAARYMTLAEFAEFRGVSASYIRRMRRNGRLVMSGRLVDVSATESQLAQARATRRRQAAHGFLTTSQYARYRDVSTSYVRRLRRSGRLLLKDGLIDVRASEDGNGRLLTSPPVQEVTSAATTSQTASPGRSN